MPLGKHQTGQTAQSGAAAPRRRGTSRLMTLFSSNAYTPITQSSRSFIAMPDRRNSCDHCSPSSSVVPSTSISEAVPTASVPQPQEPL